MHASHFTSTKLQPFSGLSEFRAFIFRDGVHAFAQPASYICDELLGIFAWDETEQADDHYVLEDWYVHRILDAQVKDQQYDQHKISCFVEPDKRPS